MFLSKIYSDCIHLKEEETKRWKQTSIQVKVDVVCTGTRQGEPARLTQIGVRLGRIKVFFEALTVAALSLAYTHNIVTDSISYEHILAGLTSLSLSVAKVHAVHFQSRFKFKILRIGSGVDDRPRIFAVWVIVTTFCRYSLFLYPLAKCCC